MTFLTSFVIKLQECFKSIKCPRGFKLTFVCSNVNLTKVRCLYLKIVAHIICLANTFKIRISKLIQKQNSPPLYCSPVWASITPFTPFFITRGKFELIIIRKICMTSFYHVSKTFWKCSWLFLSSQMLNAESTFCIILCNSKKSI